IAPSSAKDGLRVKVKFRNLAVLANLWEKWPKGDRNLTTTDNLNRVTIHEKYQVEKTLGFAALRSCNRN
ncbi:hypothetical protein LMJ43_36525, partial [Streptomyces rochei]|nr:hypothetical protein [Streptomyces rochei]